MSEGRPQQWGLIGGAGFIGQHLALSILQRNAEDRVFLLDIVTPSQTAWKVPLHPYLGTERLVVLRCDVRDSQQLEAVATNFDILVNLAAVHREPGHRPEEYFETNVSGAVNLCRMAEETGCEELIFTSSISVYGIHERPVDETTPVQPATPYGRSKHEAEQIHLEWADKTGGRLTIIRPGVVFGPGEEGNVARLVREMMNRKRAIKLKPDQPKAGVYIDELVGMIHWLRNRERTDGEPLLVNAVSQENLTFNAFGLALQKVYELDANPIRISGNLIKVASAVTRPLAALIPSGSRFHPERLAKLCRANDVRASALVSMGYPFEWPLPKALADWLERGI